GRNAFGMELHAVYGKRVMHKPHHEPVFGFGIDVKFGRHGCPLNHERVIACRLQRTVDAAKNSGPAMLDLGYLPVNRGRPHNLAAESLSYGLMAEADAQYRRGRRGFVDQFETD